MDADAVTPANDQPSTLPGSRKVRRRTIWILVGLGVIVAAGVAVGVWRLTQFTPEEVNLDAAVADAEAATTEAATEDAADDDGTTATVGTPREDEVDPAPFTVAGEWAVDTSIGTFTYESATGSFVGFRVQEELVRIGRVTAVGRTGEVSGSLQISTDAGNNRLEAATITFDLSTIATNDSRRDAAVRRALNTRENPLGIFELTEPLELGTDAIASLSGTARGLLTVNGIPVPTDFELEARIVGELIVVVGTADVVFADFDVTTPSAGIVAQADDFGVVEFQLFFRRA